jgi:polysaccharide biosynthesis/export protein
MSNIGNFGWLFIAAMIVLPVPGTFVINAESSRSPDESGPSPASGSYVLVPDDQVAIRGLGIQELDGRPARVDMRGIIDVPLVGHVNAGGLTVQQLETTLQQELKKYVIDPKITVTVIEYHRDVISIFGAVNRPGVYQIPGDRTLVQVLSDAQGLAATAGNSIHITREKTWGPLPLPDCALDPAGRFYTATVNTRKLLEAQLPDSKLPIKPGDVISIPIAEMVYVVGAVHRSGGFILSEGKAISVLQALAMAEGLDKGSSAKNAKIIRHSQSTSRAELAADLGKILSGKSPDVPLQPNDILFVPRSATKTASLRAAEAAIQIGTGLAVYRY